MKPIAGFTKYLIAEDGIVIGPRGHAVSPHINKGKLAVKIHNDDGKRISVPIHRAVAATYLGGTTGMCVRHKDGNVMNNDVENLEVYNHRTSDDTKKKNALVRSKRYARNHPEKVLAVGQKWRKDNKARSQSCTRERQARKINATPSWVNKDEIDRHYANAVYLSEVTGHKHHVDHVIPLRGKTVCGLHVENNLRVVPHFINTRKGNRLEGV